MVLVGDKLELGWSYDMALDKGLVSSFITYNGQIEQVYIAVVG